MKSLIAVCVNDTPENQRWEYTVRCLTSIGITTDNNHQIVVFNNGSTSPETNLFLKSWKLDMKKIRNRDVHLIESEKNIYATASYNWVLHHMYYPLLKNNPNLVFIRVENDMEYVTQGWADILTDFVLNAPNVGMVSPLPIDLNRAREYASQKIYNRMAKIVPACGGFSPAFNPHVIKKLGYLWSGGEYKEEGATASRIKHLGYLRIFLDPDEIKCYHIDRNKSDSYKKWKTQALQEAAKKEKEYFPAWKKSDHYPYFEYQKPNSEIKAV